MRASGDGPEPGLEPWQWPEAHWRGLVDHVRAGRRLRPAAWPGGARCAVALSFDSDHETPSLRDGETSPGRMALGEYGARAAVPRILRLLDRYEAPSSFYMPAVCALLRPDEAPTYVAHGHEVAVHGWIHERNTLLGHDDELDLLSRAIDVLTSQTGVRPTGIRTPSWDFSDNTLQITAEMGLLYDSSLMADVDCYELLLNGEPTGVTELPVEWIRDDAAYLVMDRWGGLRPQIAPHDILQIFIREFDAAYEEGGIFQLTMHPDIIGHRSRIWILKELIGHIRQHKDIWFATHADIARYAKLNG